MIRRHSTITTLASLALALGIAASTAAAAAPSRSLPRAELQRALDGVVAAGVPGAIVLVRDGSRTIRLTSGYGNVAKKTPIRATDRFRVGSLTKTFVATLVLQLVDEGKVSLDDSVERWLPGLVPNGRNISVHRLLNMTSGLFDYLDDRDPTVKGRVQAGDVTYRYTPRADDLERFYSALNRGRLLRPELLRAMRTAVPSSGYGSGLAQAKAPCGTLWGNGGDFPGFNANAYGSPDGHRQYVLFLNLDELSFTPRLRHALERVGRVASCGGRAS